MEFSFSHDKLLTYPCCIYSRNKLILLAYDEETNCVRSTKQSVVWAQIVGRWGRPTLPFPTHTPHLR
jgi:hypothetical protein